MSMGANLVCALAIKPGLRGVNNLYPTLMSPNSIMIGLYWALLYLLQGQRTENGAAFTGLTSSRVLPRTPTRSQRGHKSELDHFRLRIQLTG